MKGRAKDHRQTSSQRCVLKLQSASEKFGKHEAPLLTLAAGKELRANGESEKDRNRCDKVRGAS